MPKNPITTLLAIAVALGTVASILGKWWTGVPMTGHDLWVAVLAAAAAGGLYKARDP